MSLHTLTLAEAHGRLKAREISSVELTRAVLDRIDAVEPQVQAFITVTPEVALDAAQAADEAIARGKIAPLTGLPIGIKDVLCTRGIPTTCGSRILETYRPPYDAFVMERLHAQNAVMVGKLNMDEFAMGSTTEHSAYHNTYNPWDLSRIPGDPAAVLRLPWQPGCAWPPWVPIPADPSGSRPPTAGWWGSSPPTAACRASFGGLRLIPGPGRSPDPYRRRQRHHAPGHRRARSQRLHLGSRQRPGLWRRLQEDIRGLKVGIPGAYFEVEGLDPEVAEAIQAAIQTLKALGAETVPVDLPHTEYGVAAYYLIAPSEASSNLARYDGVKYGLRDDGQTELLPMYRSTRSRGFGKEVQRRILLGTYALSAGYYDAYYGKASRSGPSS
jgi:aspartyl-tRNA(Asn)/glutamyl-tRNA(Gln) amidotransferase subunit A